jgi:uncharacterized protein YdhG (YjbR/CyaY superfamily)
MEKISTVDQYLKGFSGDTKTRLEHLRQWVLEEASDAEEYIGYAMPAYRLNGILLYFAGYAGHIGLYPSGSALSGFEEELSAYPRSKGAIRFPHRMPFPEELIRHIIRYRVKENRSKPLRKKAARKS